MRSLFVCFILVLRPPPRPCVQATTKEIPAPRMRSAGYGSPLQIIERSKETKRKKKLSGGGYSPGLRLAPSSSASHTIHSSNLSAWAWSTSTPSSTYRPTPDNSRNLSNRLSHRGSERSTPIPFGFLRSHASIPAAANVAIGQCSRAWDLVILALPSQNQHLSSLLFRIHRGAPVTGPDLGGRPSDGVPGLIHA
jgi:hypothetical protein